MAGKLTSWSCGLKLPLSPLGALSSGSASKALTSAQGRFKSAQASRSACVHVATR